VLLDGEALEPGESAPAQLRLESPLAAERGDRIVIRQYSPMRTLGGAVVLDPAPAKHKRFRTDVLEGLALRDAGGASDLVRDAVRRAGVQGVTVAELRAARLVADTALEPALADLTGTGAILRAGDAYYDVPRLVEAEQQVRHLAQEHQKANPLAWGVGRAELQERLGHRGSKARFGDLLELLAARSHQRDAAPGGADTGPIHLRPDAVRVGSAERDLAPADRAALERIETLLRDGGATPPTPTELQAAVGAGPRFAAFASMLEEKGALVRVGDSLFYHRSALDQLEARLRQHLASHDAMSMADFKDLTGLSRKFAVPLLEYFDRKGITQRHGDDRRPGPALRPR
jgi:selenocysteine-specific elongation factor